MSTPPTPGHPRPLPRSLDPQPEETLAGYLLNLSHRLDLPPIDLAHRIGLEANTAAASIDAGFAVRLPPDVAACLAYTCGLSPSEAENLTLARWDGLLFDSTTPTRAARTLHGNGWLVPALTRACPSCLADQHPAAPQRVTWRAAWKTPWAVACTRHRVLLADTCPACDHPFGASGNRVTGLLANPRLDPLHPASCRARPGRAATLCGHRIDQQPADACPEPLLALQGFLDGLLTGRTTAAHSLGVPVSPAQYLRDLRALAVLLQLAEQRPPSAALPEEFATALGRHLDARSQRRATRPDNDRSDRTWTEPPTDTRALAALLHQAAAVLALPSPQDAHDVLPPLVASATAGVTDRRLWERVRSAARPSDGLFRYFAPKRAGTLSVHMLRAACPTPPEITTDLVPAHLDVQHYQRWFADFHRGEERNIRRAVPLAITQLVADCDLDAAADHLGIPRVSAQAAVIRAGRACKRTGRDDEFRSLVGLVAEDLQAHPVNYGHRRRHLGADWDIPEDDWQRLRADMLTARVARTDTPWERRRTDLRIWLWSHITSGDPTLAPMVQTTCGARRSTDRAIDSYTTLRRRAIPALERLVTHYAANIANHIDESPADELPPSATTGSTAPVRGAALTAAALVRLSSPITAWENGRTGQSRRSAKKVSSIVSAACTSTNS